MKTSIQTIKNSNLSNIIKEKAILNISINVSVNCLSEAIALFNWDKSNEGWDFWQDVHYEILKKERGLESWIYKNN